MSSSIHQGLSDDIISQLLASFADGRSISTFYLTLQSSRALRQGAFETIRNALVHRLKSLAADDRLKPARCEELRESIDIIREEIRTATLNIETGGLLDDGSRISKRSKSAMAISSEWCAIVDYFDLNLCLNEYTVWVGTVSTRFGQIDAALIRTPFWSITHLQHLHQQMELACESLVPPNSTTSSFARLLDQPYGDFVALTEPDVEVMERLRTSLSLDEESNRFALTPSQFEYDEDSAIVFTPTPNDQAGREILQHERHLRCLWDQQDEIDFDEALAHFGEDCLRILKRLNRARNSRSRSTTMGETHVRVAQSNYGQEWREFIGSDLSSFEQDVLL